MRSEALENIVALLHNDDAPGPSTVDEWRTAYDNLGLLVPAHLDVVVEPADGVRGEWIGSGSGPVVVYLHGGGYCIGSLTSHRAMLTHLAAATGGRVLAVDYRLAPEHPFPAALEDAVAAYRHVAAACNPSSVVVAGDSAGGGLTVATLVALRRPSPRSRDLPVPMGGPDPERRHHPTQRRDRSTRASHRPRPLGSRIRRHHRSTSPRAQPSVR